MTRNRNKYALLMLIGFPYLCFAHKLIETKLEPTSFSSAIRIENPFISRVYYHEVDLENPVTWFVFTAKKGDSIYLSIGVPEINRLKDFKPMGALIGSGVPYTDLGFSLPPETGAIALEAKTTPVYFHEPFTNTNSWIYIEETITIPESGTWYFVAYPSSSPNKGDKLWMAIGTEEKFGILDLFSFLSTRKKVRLFHEMK